MMKAELVGTSRLATRALRRGDPHGRVVLFIHGNLASSAFWAPTIAAMPEGYCCIAPDLRGFGATEALPVDATLGLDDMALDVLALIDRLHAGAGGNRDARPCHLVGHSMGGGVAMKMLRLRPGAIASATLVNPISPYGYVGSKDERGTPCHADGAPGGAGCVDPELIRRLRAKDRSGASPSSPRSIVERLYFKPPFIPEDMNGLLDGVLSTRIGDDWYPGNAKRSPNWPGQAPGERGIVNAISRRYFDASGIVDIAPKPPILWLRGADDRIVSDGAALDPAWLGAQGHDLGHKPGWPGALVCPPQPMLRQTRAVLEAYRRAGGIFSEQVIADAGHTPFLEKAAEFNRLLLDFLGSV